jgi:hypothetical protein
MAYSARIGAAALACAALISAPAATTTARTGVVPTPVMPNPDYLQPAIDPAFGTSFVRITDPGEEFGLPCESRCTHRYSSSQAWNADQTLLLLANGCSGFCFLDGATYQPLFRRAVSNECEWHPRDPALMICVDDSGIYLWAPRTDLKVPVGAPEHHRQFRFGPYKGNPSLDGNRLVVRALDDNGAPVAFAYDIPARRKYPDIRLAALPGENGHCSISASGRFVVCIQKTAKDEVYVFDLDGNQVQHWPEHHRPGHGDLAVDDDGDDVFVGISKADPDKYHVIKRRLVDGKVTDLVPYGEATHASLRNTGRPGWVFVTYGGTYSEVAARAATAPFYQEIVALRTDGSGETRRLVQTRAAKDDYWSEAHASPSPDGNRVIWSSNWGRVGGPVADYVAKLDWTTP